MSTVTASEVPVPLPPADQQRLILVASATATTGSATVRALSAMGSRVRAMVRTLDDPRTTALAALPGVTVMAADFDDSTSIAALLDGVSRCLLVSSAFAYEQFERETLFIEAAAAADLELILRISTASFLIKPGTKGIYGRAHHGIEAFAEVGGYPVVNLNPNWFLTNWMGNAEEAKTTGKISLPCPGNGPKDMHMIDSRDIGEAAAAILTLDSAGLTPFLEKKCIEIHGTAPLNFEDVAAALTKALGYDIQVRYVPRDAFIDFLLSVGMRRIFATSFVETIEQVDGIVPPGYEGYGADGGRSKWELANTSPELLKIWQPKYTVDSWASSEAVQAAFGK